MPGSLNLGVKDMFLSEATELVAPWCRVQIFVLDEAYGLHVPEYQLVEQSWVSA